MPLQAKVLSSGRSIKSLVSPVISVTIHSDIQRALGVDNVQIKETVTEILPLTIISLEKCINITGGFKMQKKQILSPFFTFYKRSKFLSHNYCRKCPCIE